MRLIFSAALGLALVIACAAGARLTQSQDGRAEKLPGLFDFGRYEMLYGKTYSSMVEQLERKRLFFARAIRAFLSGVKYKYRESGHYLALNHMSDWTERELDMQRNKVKAFRSALKDGLEPDLSVKKDSAEFLPKEGENVEEELMELIKNNREEAEFAELNEGSRNKRGSRNRQTAGQSYDSKQLRDFSLSKLINVGTDTEPVGVRAKMVSRIESNNPYYEPLDMPSFGIEDQHEEVRFWKLEEDKSGSSAPVGKQLWKHLAKIKDDETREKFSTLYDSFLPDKIFVDHRRSNCMFNPRDQGRCGSCYAFASTTVMEWLHCKKTGKLVAFSEQYMVDCGRKRYGDLMMGCSGSEDEPVAAFWHNFGMELRANYPYRARNQWCPYEDYNDLKKFGFVRMEFGDAMFVPSHHWSEYLKHSPIYIGIKSPADFSQYGGGIHNGKSCSQEADHAVLLVGHGREEGQEYWIIRNSYSTQWGENGYMRMATSKTEDCFDTDGMIFGSSDGKTFNFEAVRTGAGQEKSTPGKFMRYYNYWTGADAYNEDMHDPNV